MKATARKGATGPAEGTPKAAIPSTGSTRVVFTFDRRSFEILETMTKESDFGSMAATVRAALRVVRGLQEQAKKGYSEVIVQNPDTGEQRMLVIDFLNSLKPTNPE